MFGQTAGAGKGALQQEPLLVTAAPRDGLTAGGGGNGDKSQAHRSVGSQRQLLAERHDGVERRPCVLAQAVGKGGGLASCLVASQKVGAVAFVATGCVVAQCGRLVHHQLVEQINRLFAGGARPTAEEQAV